LAAHGCYRKGILGSKLLASTAYRQTELPKRLAVPSSG
jgi:hypothetical protein